jgi:hypothetical protein
MAILNRRQAVVTAGVAAAAAIGLKPAGAAHAAGAARGDVRIDHPGPGEEVANRFVAFGTTDNINQLTARFKQPGKPAVKLPVPVVVNPTSRRLFWYLPVQGADIPAGPYRLEVRGPNSSTAAAAAAVDFTVLPPATTTGITINYPCLPPAAAGQLCATPPDFVAYGTDLNSGFTAVSYLLTIPFQPPRTDFAHLHTPDWYVVVYGVPAPTLDSLQVTDDVDPTGATSYFWAIRD